MNLLTIYRNGVLYGKRISIQHHENYMAKKYLTIIKIPCSHGEIATYKADGNIYQIFEN